jgi:hypothetical protein
VIQQYNAEFKQYWNDADDSFSNGADLAINYRELDYRYPMIIQGFRSDIRPYPPSPNYAHAIIWWPVGSMVTHKPLYDDHYP